MDSLGGDQGEALVQAVAQLVAEDAAGAGAGAIRLRRALVEHETQQILVRSGNGHGASLRCGHDDPRPPTHGERRLRSALHRFASPWTRATISLRSAAAWSSVSDASGNLHTMVNSSPIE